MLKKIKIVRPINLGIVALTMFIVLFKFKNEVAVDYWYNALLLIIPAVLTAAAGYVINDIFDVLTDSINKPERLTVGTLISKKQAWVLYLVLTVISLLVSLVFKVPNHNRFMYFNINVSITLLLGLYAIKFKELPLIGNLFVAMCTAAVIVSCMLLAKPTDIGILNLFGYILFAFFTSLIREIVKDLQDMEGDKAAGYNTYPILAGEKGAKLFLFVLLTILIVLCGIYAVLAWRIGMRVNGALMGIITLSLFYFINHVANAKTKAGYLQSSTFMKYIMVIGVINLLFS